MLKTLYEHLSIAIVSSTINEVTRAILNSFIQTSTKCLQANKNKKCS